MSSEAVKQNRPKHQHWVPQFYLNYFATPNSRQTDQPQVWIFSKHHGDPIEKLTNVRNVCGKRYLYSPLDEDGERNWDLEEQLGNLESTLAQVWPMLADGDVDLENTTIRMGVSLFAAVMYIRNPEVRREVEEIHKVLLRFFESMPTNRDGIPLVKSIEHKGRVQQFDPSGWHDYRTWGKNEHDRFFTDTVWSEAMYIAQLLMKKRWSVVCSDHDAFITSDRPVSLHHEELEVVGFGTSGVSIMFPLSPRRMLVMDDLYEEPANHYWHLRGNIAAFNFNVWRKSSRFLITGRPVGEVLYEILEHSDSLSNG